MLGGRTVAALATLMHGIAFLIERRFPVRRFFPRIVFGFVARLANLGSGNRRGTRGRSCGALFARRFLRARLRDGSRRKSKHHREKGGTSQEKSRDARRRSLLHEFPLTSYTRTRSDQPESYTAFDDDIVTPLTILSDGGHNIRAQSTRTQVGRFEPEL